MVRAATNETRMYSFATLVIGLGGPVVDAWFNPPLPSLDPRLAGLGALAFLHLANQARQKGPEIPESVLKAGASLGKTELLFSLLCVLAIGVTVWMDFSHAPKPYLRATIVAALSISAVTVGVLWFIKVRFDSLMRAAGADPSGH